MHKPYSKNQITELVLKQIPPRYNYDLDGRYTAGDVLGKWWYTGRGKGLRLTEEGARAFSLAEIEYYEYHIGLSEFIFKGPKTYYFKFLIDLNNKIACPYFLVLNTIPTIRLYDSRIAVMVSLYGNLKEYLENTK
jgi:hypothetical protein